MGFGSSPWILNNPSTPKGSLGVCLEWRRGTSWTSARTGSGQAPHPQQPPQLRTDKHLPCADRMCQLHPPPPALQPEPRVCLWHWLLPARLCLHPAGSQGEGEGQPGQTYPYGRRCQETPLPGSRGRGSPRASLMQSLAFTHREQLWLGSVRVSQWGWDQVLASSSRSPLITDMTTSFTFFPPSSSLFPDSPWADTSVSLAGFQGSPHAVGDPLLGVGARTVPLQPPRALHRTPPR